VHGLQAQGRQQQGGDRADLSRRWELAMFIDVTGDVAR